MTGEQDQQNAFFNLLHTSGITVEQAQKFLDHMRAVEKRLDLSKFDGCLLKQIVKKFTLQSGAKFYRSCRDAKELVDHAKPDWLLPDLRYHILLAEDHTGSLDHLLLMDMKKNSWIRLSVGVPYKAVQPGAAFLNGELYIFGGSTPQNGSLRTAYKLDTNRQWERLADLNEERSAVEKSSVVFNGCIWVMGGWHRKTRSSLRTVEAYDPASNAWIIKASMNYPRYASAATVANGKIFVCGGVDVNVLDTVEYFDLQLARWTICSPRLPSPLASLSLVAHGSTLILVGGGNQTAGPSPFTTSDVWSMNIEDALPQWTRMPSMGLPRMGHAAMIYRGRLVVAGGTLASWEQKMSLVEIFDGRTWTTGPDLPHPNYQLPSTSISEELAQMLLRDTFLKYVDFLGISEKNALDFLVSKNSEAIKHYIEKKVPQAISIGGRKRATQEMDAEELAVKKRRANE